MNENMHHVLYQRRQWNSRTDSAALRQSTGLIIPMDCDVHKELHRQAWEGVSVLGVQAVRQVMNEIDKKDNYLDVIDNVLYLIDKTNDPVADFAIHAIERQLPFIKEGITRRYIGNRLR